MVHKKKGHPKMTSSLFDYLYISLTQSMLDDMHKGLIQLQQLQGKKRF
jgi:hypothetical protein